jgi:16S rRNA (cytidine1402-2'-O)-methyltransferase
MSHLIEKHATMNHDARPALGTLYLVPTPLDFGCHTDTVAPIQDTLPLQTLTTAARLTHWITENAKSTRAFLKRVNAVVPLAQPVQQLSLTELPREIHKKGDHDPQQQTGSDVHIWLKPALNGQDIGLVSEAGMPAIADPGSSIVRAAHALGIGVEVLVGPISLVMALAASGLNGQHFAFVGYLPQEAGARATRLKALEQLALTTGQTQIFIETPYRNTAMQQAIVNTLRPGTWLAISCGLTLPPATAGSAGLRQYSAPIKQWLQVKPQLDVSLPAVFMIGV